ncbi:unnamed protein product [Calypogeia fissa]
MRNARTCEDSALVLTTIRPKDPSDPSARLDTVRWVFGRQFGIVDILQSTTWWACWKRLDGGDLSLNKNSNNNFNQRFSRVQHMTYSYKESVFAKSHLFV